MSLQLITVQMQLAKINPGLFCYPYLPYVITHLNTSPTHNFNSKNLSVELLVELMQTMDITLSLSRNSTDLKPDGALCDTLL